MSLTDTEVRKAKTQAKPYSMADGGGLYLWLTPAGGKLWRWGYRFEGKEKLMSFGQYPDVTLALARNRHQAARQMLAEGIDPMAHRKAAKQAQQLAATNSFASIAGKWWEHWRNGKSPKHADSVKRRMAANIFPTLGGCSIAKIEAPEIVRMAKAIEERGVSDLAKRALETTGQIFRYAIQHGYATRNPVSDIRPRDVLKPTVKTNLARIGEKELPLLLRKIEVYQGQHVTRLAMKLMALTFVRTTELIGARWDEIDLDRGRWDIPAARMKMRTPHIVPLAPQSLEVLTSLRLLCGPAEQYVFPGQGRKNETLSNNTLLKALERMGFKGEMTGHGFRGLASTILHEQGYDHDHIELQLAHVPRNAVSAAYNHARYLAPRTKMMCEWAHYLDQVRRS